MCKVVDGYKWSECMIMVWPGDSDKIVLLLEDFKSFTEKPGMELAPKKVFIQTHGEIPLLLDYSGVAPES